jgi:CHASE2 domain-containing sensor protein
MTDNPNGSASRAWRFVRSLEQLRPRQSKRFWFALIVSVLATQLIKDNWDSLAGGTRGPLGLALSSTAGMYQQLLTAGPRTTAARYTAIVEITPGVEPDSVTLLNICNQRQFLARLTEVIDTARPSVVVLDKFFGPTTCPTSSPETQALRRALSTLIRNGTPVVVGRRINENTFRVVPALSLAEGGVSPEEGFINLHEDTRRLSLRWRVPDDKGNPLDLPTIAVAAARAHRYDLLDEPRVRMAYDNGRYPYASFLSEHQFGNYRISALALLCGPHATRDVEWTSCTGDRALLQRLHARIVLIGDNTPDQDQHPTVLGSLPGVLLQANYVEALLDERVFEAVPRLLDLILGVVVAFALEYVFVSSKRATQLTRRVILVAVITFGLSYLTVFSVGRYLNPWSVSIGAIALKLLAKVPDWLHRDKVGATAMPAAK